MFVDSWSCIFTCRLPFLLSNQQCHSIELCDRIHCLWVCLNTDGQPVLFTIWAKKRKNYDAWLFSVITSRRSWFTCDRHKGTIRNLFYITRKLNTKNRWTWENLKAVVESVKGRLVVKAENRTVLVTCQHYGHRTCQKVPSSGHWRRTCSRPPGTIEASS